MSIVRELTAAEAAAELERRGIVAAARPVAARAPRRQEPRRDVELDLKPVREAQKATRKDVRPPQKLPKPVRVPRGGLRVGDAREARVAAAVKPETEVRIGLAAADIPPAYMAGAAWLDSDPDRFAYVPPSVLANLRWQNFLLRVLEAAPSLASITVERPGLPAGHGRTWLRVNGSSAWMVVQIPASTYDVSTDDRVLRHELAHVVQEAAMFERDGAERYAAAHGGRTAAAEAWASSWETDLRPDADVSALMVKALRFRPAAGRG